MSNGFYGAYTYPTSFPASNNLNSDNQKELDKFIFQLEERMGRPYNTGFFGLGKRKEMTHDQQQFVTRVPKDLSDAIVNIIQDSNKDSDKKWNDICDIIVGIIHNGRATFPAKGEFPRIERFLHTGKDSNDNILWPHRVITRIEEDDKLKQAGGRRRRNTHRRRSTRRRTTRRRRTSRR